MYTSKYYSCEQIDQRLLQGYYDDAVANGFKGNIAEFWSLVLSIPGVITALRDELKSKHDDLKNKQDNFERSTNQVVEHLASVNSELINNINSEIARAKSAETVLTSLLARVHEELSKIKPLTEEEVSTLVNDALES